MTTTMTKTQSEVLTTKLKKILDDGILQKDLAKSIGYSPAAINTYLKGNYAGNIEEFEAKLNKYVELLDRKKVHKRIKLKFENTSVAQKFFNIANMCQLNCEIGMCFGPSGVGKTTAIKEYAKNNSSVIVIDTNECITKKELLDTIGTAFKMKKIMPGFSFQSHIEQLEEKLTDSGILLIIDEAENLDASMFQILRKIHDHSEGTFGILYVGTTQLFNNTDNMRAKFDYVVNRISITEALKNLQPEDVKLLVCQVFGEVDEDIINNFCQKSKQNARRLYSLIKRTNDVLENDINSHLSVKMIDSAAKWLI